MYQVLTVVLSEKQQHFWKIFMEFYRNQKKYLETVLPFEWKEVKMKVIRVKIIFVLEMLP